MLCLVPRSATLIGRKKNKKCTLVLFASILKFESFENNRWNFFHEGLIQQFCNCRASFFNFNLEFKNIYLEKVSYIRRFTAKIRQKLQKKLISSENQSLCSPKLLAALYQFKEVKQLFLLKSYLISTENQSLCSPKLLAALYPFKEVKQLFLLKSYLIAK